MSSELLTRIELPFLVALRYQEDAGLQDSGYVRAQGSPIPYPLTGYRNSAGGFTDPKVRDDCALWVVLFLNKLLAHFWEFPKAEIWKFSYEENLQETQCDEYRWIGMKVTSPYLEPTDGQHRQLQTVLKLLNEKLITFPSAETRLKLTFTPRQGAFNLERLKEIASMLWVTDPLLSRLHPPHCGPSSLPSLGFQFTNLAREKRPVDIKMEMGLGVLIDDPWTDRLSWHRRRLRVMTHPGELCEGRYRPGLEKIHKAESIPDLLHLLDLAVRHGGKYKFQAAYNFKNAADDTHPRIELNQHCGTLHGPAIVDWVAICKFILEPPRPAHDSSLIAASRILRQRIEQGFTVFDCLRSDGIEKMRYYKPRKEFQVPDLAYWPIRTRPVLKYDTEPGLAKSFMSLDDVERETQNWARFTKGVKGASNCTYSFGVELEMFLPTSEHPTKNLDPSFYNYQYLPDLSDQLFFDISQELRLALEKASANRASRQDSEPWTPKFPDSESSSTTGKDDLNAEIDIRNFNPVLLDKLLAAPQMSSSDTSMMDAGSLTPAHLLDSDPMDIDASSDEDTTPEKDPNPKDPREIAHGCAFPRRAHQIAEIISSLGHPAYYISNNSSGTGRPWKRELAKRGHFHVSGLNLNYHSWSIEQDGSLGEAMFWNGYWKLTGLELISPVCQDVPEDWERILEVVSGVARKIRVVEDVNCGLHVHVGKETIVFSLCHPYRKYMTYSTALMRNGEQMAQYSNNKAPHPDLKKHFPEEIEKETLLWEVVKKMWIVRDLDEIMTYCRKFSLSMSTCQALNADGKPAGLGEEEVYAKGTVEFRHLEGTMNPELVLRWAQLAVALFQFADLAKPDAWQNLIRTALKCKDPRDYDHAVLQDFLQQLGLGEDFDFWVNRMRGHAGVGKQDRLNVIIATTGQTPLNTPFERAVSEERMEVLRKELCQRDRTPPYLAQEQGETRSRRRGSRPAGRGKK